MPEYYFHVYNGIDVAIDDEGTELQDLDVARGEAIKDLLEFAITALKRRKPLPSSYCIDICDERGLPLTRVTFSDAVASLTKAAQ